jgi:hypothetical protein
MHPYKGQAKGGKAKAKCYARGGSVPNLSMNGAYKDVKGSTGNLQQHKDQIAAPGMKRGGRLDKTARGQSQAKPPSSDKSASQAGAGGISPPSAPAYPISAGAGTGEGRLQLSKKAKH